jgi:hypothetical protein
MATLVRLQVVPNNLDPLEPEAYVTCWGVIPSKVAFVERSYDEWVVSQGGYLYDPVPNSRVNLVIGPADDVDENHILMDGGLGPDEGCVK